MGAARSSVMRGRCSRACTQPRSDRACAFGYGGVCLRARRGIFDGDERSRIHHLGGRLDRHLGLGRGLRPTPPTWRRRDRDEGQGMKLLVTASEITGLPVVTVTGGEDV